MDKLLIRCENIRINDYGAPGSRPLPTTHGRGGIPEPPATNTVNPLEREG